MDNLRKANTGFRACQSALILAFPLHFVYHHAILAYGSHLRIIAESAVVRPQAALALAQRLLKAQAAHLAYAYELFS